MNGLSFLKADEINEVPANHFVVVHPLDDAAEHKVDISALGLIPITATVRLSLMVLRGYLIFMMLLVLYHVADLAGALGQHAH